MTDLATPAPSFSEAQQKHVSVQRYFEISLLLMLGTAFLTLASTRKLDSVSILLFAIAIGVKLWSYARGESGYRFRPQTVTHLSLAYLAFFAFDVAFLGGGDFLARILPATVHMILFVTVMKIFSARRYRDYGYLAALSFLMMLVSAVLTVGAGYLLGLALYVLFAISMLVSYDVKRGIERASRPPRGPYGDPARNRVAMENSLAVTTFGLAAGIALLGTLLFFVIPRYHAAYLGSLGIQAQDITGFSESVSLGELGKIKRSSRVVMRIKPHGNPRRFEGIYWRGVALDRFTGRTWYNDNAGELARVDPFWPGHFYLPPPVGRDHRPHRLLFYQVLLSGVSTDVLFAAAEPVEIGGRLAGVDLDETRSLHDARGSGVPVEYSVVSDAGSPSPRMLRADSSRIPPQIQRLDLSLPELDPRIGGLARQITKSAASNYDRALDIQNYLRDNFGYTLDPPSIEPSDPVGSFLFVSRKGYCAYFSAAMTIMLRTLGVPARVVNGFQTGEYNRVGHDFIVRARDAHSWVEVYFPTYGWVPFDPTPPDGNEAGGTAWSALDDYLDAASLFWNEWVISYDFAHQAMLSERASSESRHARRWLVNLEGSAANHTRVAASKLWAHRLLILLLVTLLAAGTWLFSERSRLDELRFRYGLKLGARSKPISAQEAALSYRQFLRILRRRGFVRSPAQTPREFALSLGPPSVSAYATEFTDLYNALRFGHQPVSRQKLLDLLSTLAGIPPVRR